VGRVANAHLSCLVLHHRGLIAHAGGSDQTLAVVARQCRHAIGGPGSAATLSTLGMAVPDRNNVEQAKTPFLQTSGTWPPPRASTTTYGTVAVPMAGCTTKKKNVPGVSNGRWHSTPLMRAREGRWGMPCRHCLAVYEAACGGVTQYCLRVTGMLPSMCYIVPSLHTDLRLRAHRRRPS